MRIQDFFWFLILVLASACESSDITFLSPQPLKSPSLNSIPSHLNGTYSIISDSSILVYFDYSFKIKNEAPEMTFILKNEISINDRSILNNIKGKVLLNAKILKKEEDFKPKNSIVEYIRHEFDSIINKHFKRANSEFIFNDVKDSVYRYNLSLTDTMFYLSDNNLIRQLKKIIYLNIKVDDHRWKVFQLQKTAKNKISINSISKDDETLLKRLMILNSEKINIKGLDPSKKTLKKFLKMKGFENKIELIQALKKE